MYQTDFSFRFLYMLFVAINGNFKLKGKEWHLNDVELMPGWSAYVPEDPYQTHIVNYVYQLEVCPILPSNNSTISLYF